MALDATKFFTNFGGGRQIHSYDATADTAATALASGYFNTITSRLHKNDLIHIVAAGGTVLQDAVVTSATGAATVTTAVAT